MNVRHFLLGEPPIWLELLFVAAFLFLEIVVRIVLPSGYVTDLFGFGVSAFSGVACVDLFGSIGKHERPSCAAREITRSLLAKIVCSALVGFVIATALALLGA